MRRLGGPRRAHPMRDAVRLSCILKGARKLMVKSALGLITGTVLDCTPKVRHDNSVTLLDHDL
jgi:hypothetical protein